MIQLVEKGIASRAWSVERRYHVYIRLYVLSSWMDPGSQSRESEPLGRISRFRTNGVPMYRTQNVVRTVPPVLFSLHCIR
jgi:hypothetical protein